MRLICHGSPPLVGFIIVVYRRVRQVGDDEDGPIAVATPHLPAKRADRGMVEMPLRVSCRGAGYATMDRFHSMPWAPLVYLKENPSNPNCHTRVPPSTSTPTL